MILSKNVNILRNGTEHNEKRQNETNDMTQFNDIKNKINYFECRFCYICLNIIVIYTSVFVLGKKVKKLCAEEN